MTAEVVETRATEQLGHDLVVHEGATLVPARTTSSLIALAGSVEDIVAAQENYQTICRALLDDSDIQIIGQREFKKKSAWRKLGVAFGVSTQILSTAHERNERGRIIRTEVVARATAPNGRFAEGIGACDLYERCCDPDTCTKKLFWEDSGKPTGHKHCTEFPCKTVHFSNPQHDIPATAATRATNRAAADLFGMGEVSAEEMSDTGQGERAQDHADQPGQARQQAPARPISEKQIPFLNKLLNEAGLTIFDLKDVIGAEVVSVPDLDIVQAKAAIDHCIGIRDGSIPRPEQPEHRTTSAPARQQAPAVREPQNDAGAKLDSITAEMKRRNLDADARYQLVCEALAVPDYDRQWGSQLTEPEMDRILSYLNAYAAEDDSPF